MYFPGKKWGTLWWACPHPTTLLEETMVTESGTLCAGDIPVPSDVAPWTGGSVMGISANYTGGEESPGLGRRGLIALGT